MATRTIPVDAAPREPMSRDRVLRAAIDLADASGIEALSMRRLAQSLGVEAMTLYYYVANKGALLDGVADIVTAEIELPTPGATPGATWKTEIRKTAMSAFDVYRRHRWAPNLILGSSGTTPARLRYMEALLGTLRGAGFSAAMTDHAYHVIESHIMGYSLWLTEMDLGTMENLAAMATAFVEGLPPGEYPYIVEHVGEHLKPHPPEDEGDYAFGLDLVLDGLERTLVAG